MLRLTAEQLQKAEALQTRRDAAGLLALLGSAWAEVAERLQARWPAFVDVALERAQQLGLRDVAELARYVNLCCLWGVGFESKPGFEWAAAICAEPRLAPRLVLHQLSQRSRQELLRRLAKAGPATQALTVASFDRAVAAVEAGVATLQQGRSIFLDREPTPLPQACDLGSVSFTIAEPRPLQAYQPAEDGWRRVELPPWKPEPRTLTAPPDEPVMLAVLSHAAGVGPRARLQLIVEALAGCGVSHPEVVQHSAGGRLHWHGAETARLSLPVGAPAPTPADATLGPAGLGHGEPPEVQRVALASCGVRDAGAPLGGLDIGLQVHAAHQHLLEVRHAALPALAWPEAEPPAPVAAAVCRLERDGEAQDAAAWLKAWQSLQPLARTGLEQLFNAWARQVGNARLDAEAAPLVGQAHAAWGWQRDADGGVALQVDGAIDFAALVLDLRLHGEIDWAGSRARVHLRAQGRTDWRMTLAQRGATAAEGQGLDQAKTSWRHPFAISVEPVATGHPALLSAGPLAEGLGGAVVGACGLRPRPDGRGQQWFYRLAIEAVNVCLLKQDPVGGLQRHRRELIPELVLIDWSAG
jgi:hypothetical protein